MCVCMDLTSSFLTVTKPKLIHVNFMLFMHFSANFYISIANISSIKELVWSQGLYAPIWGTEK